MIKIRKYRENDYSSLKKLLTESGLFDGTWESEENLSGMNSILAVDEEKVIGNVFVVPYGAKVVIIFRLAVDKNYRNRGVATMLLDYVSDMFKNSGGKEIGLFVDSDKVDLKQFYAKRGFNGSTTGSKFVVMWKPLI
jgi:ribosomal protein S18 acetylase RimI-like enzyme